MIKKDLTLRGLLMDSKIQKWQVGAHEINDIKLLVQGNAYEEKYRVLMPITEIITERGVEYVDVAAIIDEREWPSIEKAIDDAAEEQGR
jgi:hypothetical protein